MFGDHVTTRHVLGIGPFDVLAGCDVLHPDPSKQLSFARERTSEHGDDVSPVRRVEVAPGVVEYRPRVIQQPPRSTLWSPNQGSE